MVGGHCIGVDPYYLTHKAQEIGYHPEMILAGRRVNDNMGSYIAQRVIKGMTELRILVAGAKILVMGLAFKENCPDLRNSKVMDVVAYWRVSTPMWPCTIPGSMRTSAKLEYGITLVRAPKRNAYDAVVIAVAHDQFRDMGITQDSVAGQGDSFAFRRQIFVCSQTRPTSACRAWTMKLLVTGAAGFIGFHTARVLLGTRR